MSRMHPLGRQIRRPCIFRSIVEPFPRACASAPSSDVAVFAQLLQCCTSASAADHRACHHLIAVNPVRCRASSRVEAAVRVGLHVAGRSFRGRCAFSSAVCCAPIVRLTFGGAAHPVAHACTVVAEPSFTKVGSRGQGATKCAVFVGFVLRVTAVPRHEADVPLRPSVSSPTAWHGSTMYDVEGTLRCGDPRAGTRFRAAWRVPPHATSSCL